jgi:hypothetical protein
MNLNEFASKMASNGNFVKASFGGFAGSGKTRTGAEFLVGAYQDLNYTKPILLIDNEHGSRFLIPFFKKELPKTEVYVKNTTSLADVIEAMKLLREGEIQALYIDSLSKIWYKYVSDYKQKNRLTFMTLQDWGKIMPAWQMEFSDRFVDVAGTIVFTGRGGYSYEKEEDEKDEATGKVKKGQFVKSGVKMKMAGETPFEPDLNVWMEQEQEMGSDGKIAKVWREAQILKDRSGVIDGKTFLNPTYKDFQPFVKFLIGLPVGEVAGTTNGTNMAPAENFEAWDRKQSREIQMEKISGLFDKYGFSGSIGKEQKQLKAEIIEKIFGTLSMTEIEKLDPQTLAEKSTNLSVLLKELLVEDNKLEHVKNFSLPDEAFNKMLAE